MKTTYIGVIEVLARKVHPLVVSYGFSQGIGTTFLLPGREVTIEGADGLLGKLLPQCNGFRDIDEILSSTVLPPEYKEEDARHILAILLENQIVVDAYNYYTIFHEVSANPMPFLWDISEDDIHSMLNTPSRLVAPHHEESKTQLEALLENRFSTREFDGKPLSKRELLQLAWATYGKTPRNTNFPQNEIGFGTVPSGGALYPLRLFSIVLRESNDLRKGVYQIAQDLKRIGAFDIEELVQAFLDDSLAFQDASTILVLACEFSQTTQKYANRGYRYALLEAGHAAQNSYLWCLEQGLGVVEIGGFNDEKLANLIGVPYPKEAPLTTLVIGRRKK